MKWLHSPVQTDLSAVRAPMLRISSVRSAACRLSVSLLSDLTRLRAFAAAALATSLVALSGFASRPALAMDRGGYSMEILVDGIPLQEYAARGTSYVCALERREYAVRLQNNTGEKVAIALSVDGLNSIDAKSSSASEASKWILGPYETITLDGWQTSPSTSRRFFFTTERKSYGAWLGNTKNLGIVSAAVFRERRPYPPPICRDGFRGPYPCPDGRLAPGAAGPRGSLGRPGEEPREDAANQPDLPPAAPGALPPDSRPEAGAARPDGQRDARLEPLATGPGEEREAGPGAPESGTEAGAAGREEKRLSARGGQNDSIRPPAEYWRGDKDARLRRDEAKKRALSDELAATGIGRELQHEVQRVSFDHEPYPVSVLEVRYEYRDALVRLGVLMRGPEDDALARRERAHGFDDGGYAPDPYVWRRR